MIASAWILTILFSATDYKAVLPTNLAIEYTSKDKCEKAMKAHLEALATLPLFPKRVLLCTEK